MGEVFRTEELAVRSAYVTTGYTSRAWTPGWLGCEMGDLQMAVMTK